MQKRVNLKISVSNLSNFGVEPIKNALGNQKVSGPWREISIQLKDGKTMVLVMIVSTSFKSWYTVQRVYMGNQEVCTRSFQLRKEKIGSNFYLSLASAIILCSSIKTNLILTLVESTASFITSIQPAKVA